MEKVVLGLSDGVDSAVSAKLLLNAGYDVYGLYMDISGEAAKKTAENSAKSLGITLRVVDIHDRLEEYVCKPFVESYLRGETPTPCITCNPSVKFYSLVQYAKEIGAMKIATGHYAKSVGGAIYKGCPDKDQSYMLCRLTREQADMLILPLGEYTKTRVRELADEFGLEVAHKPDSREICFIKNESYSEWMAKRAEVPTKGELIYEGKVIGEHEGIHKYTVGQRWTGLFNERRLYVNAIDAVKNTVELVLWEDLFKSDVTVRDMSWLIEQPTQPFRASVRVRHTKWEIPECLVTVSGSGTRILTDTPLRAPAKGQAAALYDGDRLLGGGYIA